MTYKEVKMLEIAVKLHMATTLALQKGKFEENTRKFIEKINEEANTIIGPIDQDTIKFFEEYYD